MTVLVLVLWLAVGEIIAAGVLGQSFGGLSCRGLAAGVSPWQAILEATRPYVHDQPALGWLGTPVHLFLATSVAIALLLDGVAVAMVRVWNPSRNDEGRMMNDEYPTLAPTATQRSRSAIHHSSLIIHHCPLAACGTIR